MFLHELSTQLKTFFLIQIDDLVELIDIID